MARDQVLEPHRVALVGVNTPFVGVELPNRVLRKNLRHSHALMRANATKAPTGSSEQFLVVTAFSTVLSPNATPAQSDRSSRG